MLLTAQEVADMLRVARTTVLDPRWRSKFGLETTRIGGALRFESDDVAELIKRGREKRDAHHAEAR